MHVLYQVHCDDLINKKLKNWHEFRDFFTCLVNKEIVYQWDGDITFLEGNLIDNNLDPDLFYLDDNGHELILRREKINNDSSAFEQIRAIHNCLYDHTTVYFNLIAVL